MQTKQSVWAAQIRDVAKQFRTLVNSNSEAALRHRPAPGEWAAIEVVGHIVDKMTAWKARITLILSQEQPTIIPFDQDAYVRQHDYLHTNIAALLEQLDQVCDAFAKEVEKVPDSALARKAIHPEFGPLTLIQCIEMPLNSITNSTGHLAQFRAALPVA